jgi:hypothetical protein
VILPSNLARAVTCIGRYRFRISAGILSIKAHIFRYIPQSPLLLSGYRMFFPMVNRPVREADHSPLYNAEVKEWGHTSSFLLCLYGIQHGLM